MSATKEFSVGGCPSSISQCFDANATTTWQYKPPKV